MNTRLRIFLLALGLAAILACALVPASRRAGVSFVQQRLRSMSTGGAARAAPGAPRDSAAATPVRTVPLAVAGVVVQPEPFVLTVRATGRAEATQRAALASRVGERVHAVHVREGSHVRRGDVLIELDPRPFELALREAEARLATTQMDLSAFVLDDSTVSDAKRVRMEARTGVTAALQAVARAQFDLEATRVLAPFDGEIATVDVAVGERAQPERVLLTLVDRARIRVPAEVLESSFARIAPGAIATVTVPALDGAQFTGRVAALAPELDAARGTGIAWIEVANHGGALRPGLYCEVEIAAARLDGRLAVPRAAVLERSRRLLVFVARGGRADWAYVETGLETDDRVEITAGIAPGDTVLVDGHLTLAHGAPIRVAIAEP